MTTALIRDSNTVLNGQIASESAIRNFATELSGFSTVLAGADPDVRRLIETGSTSTIELRDFIETNRVELGSLFNNLVTTGEVIVRHLDGIKQVLVIYPYVVEGGFTVVSKSPDTGLYDAHFGMIITDTAPVHEGLRGHRQASAQRRREPADERGRPLHRARHARATRAAPSTRRAGPPPATTPRWPAPSTPRPVSSPGAMSTRPWPRPVRWLPQTLGEESWKWLFLQPLTTAQD